ncbi:MAG TPA: inositol monophosphatase family protein, partial [Methylomirabilota bacterium]|nr:inositol monophosphatase family protein [Methylomirabilota bacterium]
MTKPFLTAALEAAHAAGKILLEEFARPPHITYKGDVDLVTQADRRSEQCIVSLLQQRFPSHAIA